MLTESEKYRLSLYQKREVLRQTDECLIEKVYCTLNEKSYIKRSYPDDKRDVFEHLKSLQSPHIPQVLETFFSDGSIIIEQYIEGLTLSEWFDQERVSPKQAIAIAVQLLEGLTVLHGHGIIHRDIKPDNIIIDESGNAFLIDYGIARIYQKEAGQDTQMLGTIGFAAPEQYGFSQSDFRTDIYALGVTLTALAEASGNKSVLRRVAARCSRFDPESRYPSANAALRDLKGKKYCAKIITASILSLLLFAVALQTFNNPAETETPFTPSSQSIKPSPEESVSTDEPTGTITAPEVSTGTASEQQWISIIKNYTDEPLACLQIAADSSDEQILLTPEIELSYEMENGVLSLHLAEQTFEFSHNSEQLPDYGDTNVEGEIILYDMDGDGQDELLVALSDRILLEGVNNHIICNTNWRAVWCIGYTEGEGFWQADGMMATYGNHGGIYINYLGERELYSNNTHIFMRLIDRALR